MNAENTTPPPAIRLRQVTKTYRNRTKPPRLSLLGRIGRLARPDDLFNALEDIHLEVPQGQVLGLVGKNGSGKSSLLKIIAGITQPTQGQVQVRGKVGSLIEVGAGFHPELSGYENIYLNAAILGIPRAETEQRMPHIVEFSGLEGFMEMPVKHFSSGMYARLGFAVAAQLNPDILLLDETMAVGDARFQAKAYKTIEEYRNKGVTTLLVSHDIFTIRQYCDRVIWLDKGRIVMQGDPYEVAGAYIATITSAISKQEAHGMLTRHGEDLYQGEPVHDPPVEITRLAVLDQNGQPAEALENPERIVLAIDYNARRPTSNVRLAVSLVRQKDRVLAIEKDSHRDQHDFGTLQGKGRIRFSFPADQLLDESFEFVAAFLDPDTPDRVWSRAAVAFEFKGRRQPTPEDNFFYLLAPAVEVAHTPAPTASSDE